MNPFEIVVLVLDCIFAFIFGCSILPYFNDGEINKMGILVTSLFLLNIIYILKLY